MLAKEACGSTHRTAVLNEVKKMSENEKTIRVLPFNGKKENWSVWEEKFLARAKRKGYKKVLLGKETAPKDSETIDERTDAGKEKKRLKDANELGFEELILSIDGKSKAGKVAFALVKGCKSVDYPDGEAALAWMRLTNKFASKNTVSLLKLKREFTNSMMKTDQDPDEWITELEELQARIKDIAVNKPAVQISDEDLMIHTLNYLPRKYDIEKHYCEKKLEAGTLNMSDLRESLGSRYAIEFDNEEVEEDDEEGEEKALIAKQFKGKCNFCGKWGHKAADCREKKKSEGGKSPKFNGTCNFCGKYGHKEKDCWSKQRQERANVTQELIDEVILMMYQSELTEYSETEEHPDDDDGVALAALESNNIWIGDTGATCHLVARDYKMINVKMINEEIRVGNGSKLKAKKLGDLPVIIKQADGKETEAVLKNVKYVPRLMCNLFSIVSALSRDGSWQMKGKPSN